MMHFARHLCIDLRRQILVLQNVCYEQCSEVGAQGGAGALRLSSSCQASGLLVTFSALKARLKEGRMVSSLRLLPSLFGGKV